MECTGSRSVRRDSSTGFGIDVATSVAMDETKFRRKWDRVHPQDDVTLSPQRRKHSTVVTTGSPTVARRLGSSVPASAGSPPCVTHGGIEGAVEASGRDSPGSSIARAIAPRSGKAMPGFRHLSPARFGATVPGSGVSTPRPSATSPAPARNVSDPCRHAPDPVPHSTVCGPPGPSARPAAKPRRKFIPQRY